MPDGYWHYFHFFTYRGSLWSCLARDMVECVFLSGL
jgi:hypothetical protein